MKKRIVSILTCLGCIGGGAFSASFLMVVIGEIWFSRYEPDRMFTFFETARVPVGLIGATIGGAIFLRSIRKPQKEKNCPNKSLQGTPGKVPFPTTEPGARRS